MRYSENQILSEIDRISNLDVNFNDKTTIKQ